MSGPPLPTGKLPPSLLDELLRESGAPPAELIVGPTVGEDGCAIAVADGVLVAATDPITLTGAGVGRSAVIVNANDVAVMGAPPRWFLAAVLLPPGTTEADVRDLFAAMHEALDHVGATLVGGHTEVTPAVVQPVVVGQMLGVVPESGLITTGGARPGDVVVQVGPVPIEGAAVLVDAAPERVAHLDPSVLDAARRAPDDPGISVVDAALASARLGASSLHDPTEGGLAGALHELAQAAGVALRLEPSHVLWFEPGVAICEAVGADPWATLASGALLAAFPAARVGAALDGLRRLGLVAAQIATVVTGAGVWTADGLPFPRPLRDEVARVLSS